jgi:hypothetical protein
MASSSATTPVPPPGFRNTRRLAGTGRPGVPVIGESRYQRALWSAVGGFRTAHLRERVTAALLLDPENPDDPDAVAVHLATTGEQVGHLEARDAHAYGPALRVLAAQGVVGTCPAVIVGGGRVDGRTAMLGVWLDLAPPADVLHDPSTYRRVRRPAANGVNTGAATSPRSEAGYYRGHHFTDYVEDVKALKRHGALDAAVTLLRHLIDAVEAEAATEQIGVAPWYYEQLAIVLRKQGDLAGEVAVLERYGAQPHAPGASVSRLRERLETARRKLEASERTDTMSATN